MRAYLGKDYILHQKGKDASVVWDSASLISGHTLFLGRPGSGKTYQIRRFLGEALGTAAGDVRVHIFDVHEDIEVAGASEVQFSAIAPYGLNPLRVSGDPLYGGVHRCINQFLRTLEGAAGGLGARQLALMRNILLDVYKMRGFNPEDPSTWVVDPHEAHFLSDGTPGRLYLDIPYEEKDEAKAVGNIAFDRNMRSGNRNGCWYIRESDYTGAITRWMPATAGRMHPTLDDVVAYTRRQMLVTFMGADQAAVTALQGFLKASRAHYRKELQLLKAGGINRPSGAIDGSSDKERLAARALEAFGHYLEQTRSGDELEELIKYDKVENLRSIIDRLDTLKATGIFKSDEAPFDPRAKVWRYRLKPLSLQEKRMFVLFRLQELYYKAIERGAQTGIRDIIVVDEAHNYADEDGEDVLSMLAREARKFGVAIIAATQFPSLPTGFMASLATKVVLGIDDMFVPQACSKMGLTKEQLAYPKPQQGMLVQMQDKSPLSGKWRLVALRTPPPIGAGARAQEMAPAR